MHWFCYIFTHHSAYIVFSENLIVRKPGLLQNIFSPLHEKLLIEVRSMQTQFAIRVDLASFRKKKTVISVM